MQTLQKRQFVSITGKNIYLKILGWKPVKSADSENHVKFI